MSGDPITKPSCRSEAERLARQFNWRLLTPAEWAEAANALDPAPTDHQAARRACLSVYSRVLFEACQDPTRWNQAYRELYDYLWPQAAARSPAHANELAQGAIVRVFEAFQASQPSQRPLSGATFLRFAQLKLREAVRECCKEPEEDHRLQRLADPSPPPDDQIIAREDHARRASWIAQAQPYAAGQVLACLRDLWRRSRRLHRQLTTVILTYMDCCTDSEIARLLGTSPVNVQPLRSRGLDHLGECLRTQLNKELGYGSQTV